MNHENIDLPPGWGELFGLGFTRPKSDDYQEPPDEYQTITLRFVTIEEREKAAKRIIETGMIRVRVKI